MVELVCKKCGSANVKKNGLTKSGRQKYHCRACGVYTITLEGRRDWPALLAKVERLHHQGMSQRAIAEETGVSRPTIIAYLKKKSLRQLVRA
jgi:transposase-like protein